MDRRTFLSGLAVGVGGISGCLGGPSPPRSARSNDPESTTSPHDWPTFGHDFANSGYNPETTAPVDDARVAWEKATGTPTALSSPVVIGDTVIGSGTGDPGGLLALDVTDGSERWTFSPEEYVVAAPTVVDNTVYVGGWSGRFYAIDFNDGTERWHVDVPARFGRSSPIVRDGSIYVGTLGYEPLTISADSNPNIRSGRVVSFDIQAGERTWEYGDFGEHERIDTSPALGGGRVYATSDKGSLVALDAESGDEVWRRSFTQDDHGIDLSAPVFEDGVVYVSAWGELIAVDAGSGETQQRIALEDIGGKSSPAIADGTAYVATSGTRCPEDEPNCGMDVIEVLYVEAIDLSDGSVEWTYERTHHGVQSSPAISENAIFLGIEGAGEDLANGVIAIDRAGGSELWSINLGATGPALFSSPAVSDRRAFIEAPDGRIVAIEE